MAAGGGAEPNWAELEHIAVKEQNQLPPVRSLSGRMRQFADQVGHCLLLELCEVNQELLVCRVAQDASGRSAALGRGWHRRAARGRSPVAPGSLECRVAAVPPAEPGPPASRVGWGVAVQAILPGVLIEPFAGILAAGMIARHVLAKLALQMLDQGGHPRGGVTAIEWRCHHCMMLLRTVLPGHDFVRAGLAPPIRRIGPESRQEESPRVC